MSEQFIEDAIRTKSDQWHGDKVHLDLFKECLEDSIHCGGFVDGLKKKLFYNKDMYQWDEYTDDAPLVGTNFTQNQIDVIHAILGIYTEGVELLEALYKFLEVGVFDDTNLKEEFGDIFWYQAILAKALNTDFGPIQDKVIAKLKHRYPEKFTS